MQRRTTVTGYFPSKQLLLFAFAQQPKRSRKSLLRAKLLSSTSFDNRILLSVTDAGSATAAKRVARSRTMAQWHRGQKNTLRRVTRVVRCLRMRGHA